jgi:NADH dehydrogenase/NADH:ubiquinone oxidoreductase subunit G
MIQLKINGKTVQADDGQTILDVARAEDIKIPTLCFHEKLGSSGRCKLCVVQVRTADGDERIVASCLYKAKEGMEIVTDSPEVALARKKNLSQLIAMAPSAERLQYLAIRYGLPIPDYTPEQEGNKCILCTLCVRTCKKVVGVGALSVSRKIQVSDACIGCGACVVVCPTGHIKMAEANGTRTVWGKSFDLAACPKCGRPQAPLFQLQWISERVQVPLEELLICPDCR